MGNKQGLLFFVYMFALVAFTINIIAVFVTNSYIHLITAIIIGIVFMWTHSQLIEWVRENNNNNN